jgi:hypothetical protein
MTKLDAILISLTVTTIVFVMVITHKAFVNLEIILTHYLGGN